MKEGRLATYRLVDVTTMMVFVNDLRLRQLGYRMYQAMDDAGNDVARFVAPPLVTVPAGPFRMGRNLHPQAEQSAEGRTKQTLTLAEYQIAVYPLTIAEYACFARAVP